VTGGEDVREGFLLKENEDRIVRGLNATALIFGWRFSRRHPAIATAFFLGSFNDPRETAKFVP
jgi:hypothetical protein